MKTYLIFLTFLALTFVACDIYNDVSYIVSNQTSDSLKLDFKYSEDYFGINTGDTIICLQGHSETVLFVHSVISPRVYNPETEEKMLYIADFDIIRIKDSSLILKDVTLRKNWDYQELGKHAAEITFLIDDSDF
jgi:hypothetical protein